MHFPSTFALRSPSLGFPDCVHFDTPRSALANAWRTPGRPHCSQPSLSLRVVRQLRDTVLGDTMHELSLCTATTQENPCLSTMSYVVDNIESSLRTATDTAKQ